MEFSNLLERCRKKDVNAFNEFVNKFYSLIIFLISKRVASVEGREDLAQEILIKFYKNQLFDKFRGNTETEFKSYLTRITLNNIFNWFSKEKRESENLIRFNHADLRELDPR